MCKEMFFKAIQKLIAMDVSVSGTIDQKNQLKTFRGKASAPLVPSGSAYDLRSLLCVPFKILGGSSTLVSNQSSTQQSRINA